MPDIVPLLDKVFVIRNAFYRDTWHGPERRQDKVPLMEMHDVANTLPKHIPVARVPPSRVSGLIQQKTLELVRRQAWQALRRSPAKARPAPQWTPAEADASFQDGLRSSMAMLLQMPTPQGAAPERSAASVPDEFVLNLTYHGVPVRPEVEPLDCLVHLSRCRTVSGSGEGAAHLQNRQDPENDLLIRTIEYQGATYTRSHPDFGRISSIVLTSLLTTGTIKHHFLYTHVLTGATMYSTAAHHLSKTHPIYVFVHPHGYEVARGNVYKAQILVGQSLVSDWSFDEPAVRLLMNKWTEEFRLSDLLPSNVMRRSGFTPETVRGCPSLDRAWKMWLAFERYATQWVDVTYGGEARAEEGIAADRELTAWYHHLAGLPYGVVPGPVLNRENLIRLLASYIYVCVFYHQVFGDEPRTRDLVRRADLIVPRLLGPSWEAAYAQQIVSKRVFHVIFQSVVEKHESFADPKWPKAVPAAYQPLVEDLQRRIGAISPERWEIGINK